MHFVFEFLFELVGDLFFEALSRLWRKKPESTPALESTKPKTYRYGGRARARRYTTARPS